MRDDPERRTREISVAALYALFHNEFDHLATIKQQFSLAKEELILLAEIAVDLAHVKNEFEKAFKISRYSYLLMNLIFWKLLCLRHNRFCKKRRTFCHQLLLAVS